MMSLSVTANQDSISSVSIGVLSLLIVILNTPILSRNLPNIALIGLMILFILLNIKKFLTLKKGVLKILGLVLVYLIYIAVYKACGISSADFYYFFNEVQFLFMVVTMTIITGRLSSAQAKFIVSLVLATTLFNMASNYLLYLRYGNGYLLLYQTQKYSFNVYSTQNTTAIMFFVAIMFTYYLHAKTSKKKTMSIVIAIIGFIFSCVVTQRMTAILLCIIMVILIRNFNVQRNAKQMISSLLLILLLVLFYFYYKPILNFLADFASSDRIRRRINQIINLLDTQDFNESGGSLGARYSLLSTSFSTWRSSIKSILWGVGDHRSTNTIIGNHGQLVDILARYGIICWGVTITFLFRAFSHMKSSLIALNHQIIKQVNVICLIFLIRGVMGTIFEASIGIQIFIFMPAMLQLINEEEEYHDSINL